jgi:hypothetical protein
MNPRKELDVKFIEPEPPSAAELTAAALATLGEWLPGYIIVGVGDQGRCQIRLGELEPPALDVMRVRVESIEGEELDDPPVWDIQVIVKPGGSFNPPDENP